MVKWLFSWDFKESLFVLLFARFLLNLEQGVYSFDSTHIPYSITHTSWGYLTSFSKDVVKKMFSQESQYPSLPCHYLIFFLEWHPFRDSLIAINLIPGCIVVDIFWCFEDIVRLPFSIEHFREGEMLVFFALLHNTLIHELLYLHFYLSHFYINNHPFFFAKNYFTLIFHTRVTNKQSHKLISLREECLWWGTVGNQFFSVEIQFLLSIPFWEHFWLLSRNSSFNNTFVKKDNGKILQTPIYKAHKKGGILYSPIGFIISDLVLTKKSQQNHFRKNSFIHRKIYFNNKRNYNQKWNMKICYLHSSIHKQFLPNIYSQSSNI